MNKGATKETLDEASNRYKARWQEFYDDSVVVEFLRADNRAITCPWVQAVVHKWFQFGNFEMLSMYVGNRRANHETKVAEDLLYTLQISKTVNAAGGNKSEAYNVIADELTTETDEGPDPEAIKKRHQRAWRRLKKKLPL